MYTLALERHSHGETNHLLTMGCLEGCIVPRTVSVVLALLATACGLSSGQTKPNPNAGPAAQEFPVALQQNVTAGKTPVGTKIEAKLTIASLVNGTVVPRNATFSGEVVESVAKSGTQPSRVSVEMNSLKWKNGSMPVKMYLTAWYYPSLAEAGQNLQYGPEQGAARTWNGAGAYPDPNSPAYKPFPGGDSGQKESVPETPNSVTSKHRELMKDVQSERAQNGRVTLLSKRNLKLDRVTTYVLAPRDLAAPK
jgi:hypothetical protein